MTKSEELLRRIHKYIMDGCNIEMLPKHGLGARAGIAMETSGVAYLFRDDSFEAMIEAIEKCCKDWDEKKTHEIDPDPRLF